MIIHNVEQNTPEWFELRKGIITASSIQKVLSKWRSKNQPSKTRYDYLIRLLSERLGNDVEDGFEGNRHTERGHIHEPQARGLYAFKNDVEPEQVGFITDDDRTVGASPDSLVGADGCLEIKSKLAHIHLPVLLSQEVPAEHVPQIQTQLWIAEREWCDFVSYYPELPLVEVRVYRDEDKIKQIAEAVEIFNAELFETEFKVKQLLGEAA